VRNQIRDLRRHERDRSCDRQPSDRVKHRAPNETRLSSLGAIGLTFPSRPGASRRAEVSRRPRISLAVGRHGKNPERPGGSSPRRDHAPPSTAPSTQAVTTRWRSRRPRIAGKVPHTGTKHQRECSRLRSFCRPVPHLVPHRRWFRRSSGGRKRATVIPFRYPNSRLDGATPAFPGSFAGRTPDC
jgi:hypothetical protein